MLKVSDPELKQFAKPDEVRTFPKGKTAIVNVGGNVIGLATFEPGWRWSESVKPIVNTESCQQTHLGYLISGVLMVQMDDGRRIEAKPGDVLSVPPGHDAWVVGNEPVVVVDFQGMAGYAVMKKAA